MRKLRLRKNKGKLCLGLSTGSNSRDVGAKNNNLLVMLGALACAVLVSSCSVNDDIGEAANNAVRFTAGIGEVATPQSAPGTRAAGTDWAENDAIGICVFYNVGFQNITANKQYETKAGDGNFTAVAGNEIYYPMDGSALAFTAYYPYESSALSQNPLLDIAIGNQANQPSFDLLWAKADNDGSGYDKVTHATTPVVLTFEHKLSKLVMNCTADASVGVSLTGMTVTINGMNTQNTFDVMTGELGTPGNPLAITPRTVADGTQYDAIIMPDTYGTDMVTVDFTLSSSETFTWKVPATTFTGSKEYTYEITLTRTGVNFTGTIKPWNPVTGNPGTAD